MPQTDLYTQAELRRSDGVVVVLWVPSALAREGKRVTVADMPGEWEIREVYKAAQRTKAQLDEQRRYAADVAERIS